MYFLISRKYKFIFATSPKAGCQHINFIFNYIHGYKGVGESPFLSKPFSNIPDCYKHFTVVVFLRNPFERIISGFREKYGKKKIMFKGKDNLLLTFRQFLNELYNHRFRIIDQHHFEPQTTNMQSLPKNIKVFDIKSINYKYIGNLCNQTIPKHIIHKKGNHIDKTSHIKNEKIIDEPLYKYLNFKIPISNYYEKDLENKIRKFYQNDFLLAKSHGLQYNISGSK